MPLSLSKNSKAVAEHFRRFSIAQIQEVKASMDDVLSAELLEWLAEMLPHDRTLVYIYRRPGQS